MIYKLIVFGIVFVLCNKYLVISDHHELRNVSKKKIHMSGMI